jgi:hypothetical protein
MSNKIARQLPAVCILAMFVALVFGQSAFAAGSNSSVETYAGGGGNAQAQISAPDPTPASAPSQSTGALPFTGFDLALAAGGGLVLLGAGAMMAMAASRKSHTDQS